MSETSSFLPPNFLAKPFPGDKGYELVRKSYTRFLWTWNDFKNKKLNIPKGDPVRSGNSNESETYNRYTGEIQSIGHVNSLSSDVLGYKGPLKKNEFMNTDDHMDPDSKEYKKMKRLISFDKFQEK